MRIFVTGSTAYDVMLGYNGSFAQAIDPKALDSLSVSFYSPHYKRHHGGTGANIAWNLKLLGTDPLLVSTVGTDGQDYLSLFQEKNIDTTFVEKRDDSVTATAIIGTDSGERQIVFFHPGADAVGVFPDLHEERDDIAYAIISPRNATLMMEAVEWCKKFGVAYIFDPGQQIIGLSDDELRRGIEGAFALVVNEYEWGLIKDRLNVTPASVIESATHLVITRGENGVSHFDAAGTKNIPAPKADQVVNPTGAGDALRAGFLHGLLNKWTVEQSLRLGNMMGALVVGLEGTLIDSLDREELNMRAEETYGEKLPL